MNSKFISALKSDSNLTLELFSHLYTPKDEHQLRYHTLRRYMHAFTYKHLFTYLFT